METVWSLLYDAIYSGKERFICNALERLHRDGKVTEADAGKVSKAIKRELGDNHTVEDMLGVVYPHAKARTWRLDWLKKMHEKTVEETQQPKVEHMKTLSFKEAMYALADGMVLYNEDGTVADTFVRSRKFMIGGHPHAEVIRAFGDGEEVQFFEDGEWVDTGIPGFYRDHEYRVKPKQPKDGDTIQLSNGSIYTVTTARRLREMFGLGQTHLDELVVFKHDEKNVYGVTWDRLTDLLRDGYCPVVKIFKSAKE